MGGGGGRVGTETGLVPVFAAPGEAAGSGGRGQVLVWGVGGGGSGLGLPAWPRRMGLKDDVLVGFSLCVLSPFMIHQ